MTPDPESLSTSTRLAASRQTSKKKWRSRLSAVGAGLAVVGFSAAMLAPAGSAVADPSDDDNAVTAYALVSENAQDITVTVEGGQIADVEHAAFEVYVKPKPKPTPKPEVASSTSRRSSGGGGSASRPQYTGGGSKEQWMAAAGIAQSDWAYVDYIVRKESGWNPNATNRSSGACGLVQALPCSKVPGNGYNPVDNLRWGSGYAKGRYGGWAGAYAFWTRNHWW